MPNNILRRFLRSVIHKQKRHNFIDLYLRWEYWYRQGLAIVTSFKLTSMVEIMGVIAFVKYVVIGWDQKLTVTLIICTIVALAWILLRTFLYWYLGKFWHDNGGYARHTRWNCGKVPPSRTEIVNIDLLALKIALYSGLSTDELKTEIGRIYDGRNSDVNL